MRGRSIDSQRLLLGRLDERDWVRLTRLLGRVADAPLTIDAPLEDLARERGEVARSLKLLARELAVPVVALSRLPQPRRVARRPVLENLSEGERQAAGLVVLVHRPELDDPWTPRRGEADLIMAKHQAGPTDVVTAVFQGQYCRFAPWPCAAFSRV